MSFLFFCLGFFSLWLIPGYFRLNLPYLFFIFLSTSLIWQVIKKKLLTLYFSFLRKYVIFLGFLVLYVSTTIFAAIYHKNLGGILPPFVVFCVFFFWSLVIFLIERNIDLKVEKYALGFWYGALFTALYILLEAYFYYSRYIALTEMLFPKYLLKAAGEHTYFNEDYSYLSLFERPLFRPAGLSWDPGLTLPALVLAFILAQVGFFSFPFKKTGLSLLLLALIVSTSKTALGGLFIYFFAKFFFWVLAFLKNPLREKLEKISPVLGLFSFFAVGLFFFKVKEADSFIIHLRYLASLVYLGKANFVQILSGFGYRNTGHFYREYVGWAKEDPFFPVTGHADIESLLTNVFLWGGVLGSLFWVFTYAKAYLTGGRKEKLLLLAILGLAFGYNFHTLWFLCFYFFLFWFLVSKKLKDS